MPFYVEFPTDPVVNVHWKKPDEPPPPDDGSGTANYPCGKFGGSYPAMPYWGLNHYVIDVFTLLPLGVNLSNQTAVVVPNALYQDPGVVFQGWGEPVGPFVPGVGPVPAQVYWPGYPRFYTVTVAGPGTYGIDVFYHTAWSQMTWTTPPDETGVGSLDIDRGKVVRGPDSPSGPLTLGGVVFKIYSIDGDVKGPPLGATFAIQSHCIHEYGGVPPQPPYS